ncbi:PQQ-binding-like beta-propeller repeat protein [Picrophilus oshimae]|uniref:Quinoprotein dehydrogenase n=1 Tax=Picrophilus torridus (strain ATCC 700027 / DSM 9790 / JCM 10055 / NBRC 100828 / KAW 2/3) TaxID=1122961 RepID=Q6L099_PICTO|nr:PQQ-binding-like beta-propeller repeat protein [Picrophilus oshimae]AAT43603.1 quinoprotein dehydrogenase [Picrophilus oshimae DSM 9789]
MNKKIIVAIVIAVLVGAGIGAGVTYVSIHKPVVKPEVKPRVTVYREYNGMYFPYALKVTFYKNNESKNYGFPSNWPVTSYNTTHETVFTTTNKLLNKGVSWNIPIINYAGGNAIPLNVTDSNLPAAHNIGNKSALTTMTQYMGEPLGVTLSNNLVYVEEDTGPGSIFALNPSNGSIVWYATGLASQAMNNPIVYHGIVYVTVGDTGFSFAQIEHALHNESNKVRRGLTYGAIYAFNATDGKLLWMNFTTGETMPSPAVHDGIIAYADGGGQFIGLNATTGKVLWSDHFGGFFDNMGSVTYYVLPNGTTEFIAGYTFVGAPHGLIIAVNGTNGRVLWKTSMKKPYIPYDTGMGDVPLAVDPETGMIYQSAIANYNSTSGRVDTVTMAINAVNGSVVWETNIGRGYVPPAFKGGIPLIYHNMVYTGDQSTGSLVALYANNGTIAWSLRLPDVHLPPKSPGGPRGSPVYYNGVLFVGADSYIYAINATTGSLINKYYIGGRFGIVNPVIAGNTMFLTNSYGWVTAVPLNEIDPGI